MSCLLEASIESRLWGTPSHLHPFLPGASWPAEAPYTWADPHYHLRKKTNLILTGHQSVNQNYSKRRKEVKFWLELKANILIIVGVFLGVRRITPRLRRWGLLIQTRNRTQASHSLTMGRVWALETRVARNHELLMNNPGKGHSSSQGSFRVSGNKGCLKQNNFLWISYSPRITSQFLTTVWFKISVTEMYSSTMHYLWNYAIHSYTHC